jgi:hypothetical protein
MIEIEEQRVAFLTIKNGVDMLPARSKDPAISVK